MFSSATLSSTGEIITRFARREGMTDITQVENNVVWVDPVRFAALPVATKRNVLEQAFLKITRGTERLLHAARVAG